jgi:RND family efflux transporter MFP subunit
VLSDLEQARTELKRAENLRQEELISEQRYDINSFRVKGLEKKALALKAEVEHLEIEIQKKVVRVPFEGVVIKKHIDSGEWLSSGDTVATIAKDDIVDIIVEVPEGILNFVKQGAGVNVKTAGRIIRGKVSVVIPSGDVSTRTFPVKIRVRNKLFLMEGMEARVNLPVGKKTKTLIVSRDAVIPVFGIDAVFSVIDNIAKMIPVKVAGYDGMKAGVFAEGLKEGMRVVVKGNERLRDGQEVRISNE